VNLEHPLFPDDCALTRHLMNIDLRRYHHLRGRIIILLPNYQARIAKVEIGSKHARIEVFPNEISESDILVKINYLDKENVKFGEYDLKKNEVLVPLSFKPDAFYVYVLSKRSGELLDYKDIHLTYPLPMRDVFVELQTEDIRNLIDQGENETVEFKREIKDEKSKISFMQTVISFSNTKGGIILLGVDDQGSIIGIFGNKVEEQISNIISSRCEQTIDYTVKSIYLEDKTIYAIQIQEGKDKPYVLRDKGVYVRRGSTDRIANRYELDEIYKSKYSSY